jgi:hypothetical protein
VSCSRGLTTEVFIPVACDEMLCAYNEVRDGLKASGWHRVFMLRYRGETKVDLAG